MRSVQRCMLKNFAVSLVQSGNDESEQVQTPARRAPAALAALGCAACRQGMQIKIAVQQSGALSNQLAATERWFNEWLERWNCLRPKQLLADLCHNSWLLSEKTRLLSA